MLSVFNNPSQLGLWIAKECQEGIYMRHFDFLCMQIDMKTKKQTESLLILNAIISKAFKK